MTNLKDYSKDLDEIMERQKNRGEPEKMFRVFDEEENILYKCNGVGGGAYWSNSYFHCSKCLKGYFSKGHMKRHALKCKGILQEGLNVIDSNSNLKLLELMNSLSRMSRRVQGIDFSMSDEPAIRKADKTVLLFVLQNKPIGYITFCKRDFKEGTNKISIDDFFVMEYLRRRGYGDMLFNDLLNRLNIDRADIKEIETKLTVNSPSISLTNFLRKRGYLNLQIW